MYSVTKALAAMISGAVAAGVAEDGGGREGGEGAGEDDVGDAGSCGYKDAGSEIDTLWKASARETYAFDRASVLFSSIDSGASSNESTV